MSDALGDSFQGMDTNWIIFPQVIIPISIKYNISLIYGKSQNDL